MLRFYCNHSRVLIPTPSCLFMPPKCPCTEIPSRNAKISTLDPHNFFLAMFCGTKFKETLFLRKMNLVLKGWALLLPLQFWPKCLLPPYFYEVVEKTFQSFVRVLAGSGPKWARRVFILCCVWFCRGVMRWPDRCVCCTHWGVC